MQEQQTLAKEYHKMRYLSMTEAEVQRLAFYLND